MLLNFESGYVNVVMPKVPLKLLLQTHTCIIFHCTCTCIPYDLFLKRY